MEEYEFLEVFPKNSNDIFICYDVFTFVNLFKLLLNENLEHEEALSFILANCSLSAIVFQEYIHNNAYRYITKENVLTPGDAARKAYIYSIFESFI